MLFLFLKFGLYPAYSVKAISYTGWCNEVVFQINKNDLVNVSTVEQAIKNMLLRLRIGQQQCWYRWSWSELRSSLCFVMMSEVYMYFAHRCMDCATWRDSLIVCFFFYLKFSQHLYSFTFLFFYSNIFHQIALFHGLSHMNNTLNDRRLI